MKTVDQAPATESAAAGATAAHRALAAIGVLAGVHFLIDFFASSVNPLWQDYERRVGVAREGLLPLYVAWVVATSLSQLAFGWWSDRSTRRVLIWIGPLAGILCVSAAALVRTTWLLAPLLVIAGLGIASFHPEAAATAGAVMPARRSRMMAIFALSGYLGQSAGPYCSGTIESAFGLPALAWGSVAGVMLLACLATARGNLPPPIQVNPSSDAAATANPLWLWMLVLTIGAMRILPAMGVPLIVTYWLEDSATIGLIQSAFMGGIGAGSILCAMAVRPRHERAILCLLPIAAAPCIAALPMLAGPSRIAATGLAGFLLGIAMPVFISYGQQLFPHRPRAASSVTMGVSWGVAGGLAATTVWAFGERSSLGRAFWVIAVGSVLAGVMSLFLPRVERERAST